MQERETWTTSDSRVANHRDTPDSLHCNTETHNFLHKYTRTHIAGWSGGAGGTAGGREFFSLFIGVGDAARGGGDTHDNLQVVWFVKTATRGHTVQGLEVKGQGTGMGITRWWG